MENKRLKNAIESLYEPFLPKNSKPFAYVSLIVNPNNMDVNVHPTKNEVRILHEDAIVEEIKKAILDALSKSNSSRVFYAQASLPSISNKNEKQSMEKRKEPPSSLVRKNDQSRQMEKYLLDAASSLVEPAKKKQKVNEEAIRLTSIQQLIKEIEQKKHEALCDILTNGHYVGWVNTNSSLIQHTTKLYLVDTISLRDV